MLKKDLSKCLNFLADKSRLKIIEVMIDRKDFKICAVQNDAIAAAIIPDKACDNITRIACPII